MGEKKNKKPKITDFFKSLQKAKETQDKIDDQNKLTAATLELMKQKILLHNERKLAEILYGNKTKQK